MRITCREKIDPVAFLKNFGWKQDRVTETLERELYDTIQAGPNEYAAEHLFFRYPMGMSPVAYAPEKTRADTNLYYQNMLPDRVYYVATGLKIEARAKGGYFRGIHIPGGTVDFFIGSKVYWGYPTDIGVGAGTPLLIVPLQNFGVSLRLPRWDGADLRCRLQGFMIRPVQ